jgi:hypothetical protein
MTCADVHPLLSDYVDDLVTTEVRAAIAAHCETCASCRGVVTDLDRLRDAARSLGPITPPAHLWMEIAGRIRLEQSAHQPHTPVAATPRTAAPRAASADRWQWLGLAAALLLVTAGVYVMSQPDDAAPTTSIVDTVGNVSAPPTVETIGDTLLRAQAEYELAIAQLEDMVTKGDASMSPEVVETLQRTVGTIDSAIAESRAALTENPASQPARTSLFEALGQKVSLLQQTVVLMNEMRQGDASGAAEAAAGVKTKTS